MHYTKIHMLHLTLLRGGSEPCHYKVFNEQPRAAAVEEREHKSSRQIISEEKVPGFGLRRTHGVQNSLRFPDEGSAFDYKVPFVGFGLGLFVCF